MSDDAVQSFGSRAAFPATSWTLIRQTQGLSATQRAAALEVLLQRYWKPIYAYFRSQSKSRDEAEELTQEFLCGFVEHDPLVDIDATKGRFRDWLRACLANFLISQRRRETAAKRRPMQGVLSLENLQAADGAAFEPAIHDSPDQAFADAWRRDLIQRALQVVKQEAHVADRDLDVRVFLDYYRHTAEQQPTWQEIADRHGLSDWKHASRRADWVKTRLGKALRREVACYVETEQEVDEEIGELLG